MSDYYCGSCGDRLKFRIMPVRKDGTGGGEATICEKCNPEIYAKTKPVNSVV